MRLPSKHTGSFTDFRVVPLIPLITYTLHVLFRYENGIAVPVASDPLSPDEYRHEPSNSTHMLATTEGLHLADPMETRLLRVDVSTEEDAGLGLFLRVDVNRDQALAFYNGITANKKTYNTKSFYKQDTAFENENEVRP
jgi:hypothetical protein